MDELTKKDIEERKKEEDAMIEATFPSYFDEFQKQLLSLTNDNKVIGNQRDSSKVEVVHKEVRME